jgi:hypothetical protein
MDSNQHDWVHGTNGETEKKLFDIWKTVLKVKMWNMAKFFELGDIL